MTVLSTASRPVDGTGQAPLYILPAGYRAPRATPRSVVEGTSRRLANRLLRPASATERQLGLHDEPPEWVSSVSRSHWARTMFAISS